ncbi:AsmA family protein [bacterium]|nr:AsmA family protein [bacterium]
MKNFLKVSGYTLITFILIAYLAFLFVLPNVIDLNEYKTDLQKIVEENSGLTVDFTNAKLITTPLLEAGVKINGAKVILPDNSVLFKTDKLKAKLFLPSLMWFQVFVSEIKFENPNLNAEIIDSEQYKAVRVYENFVNAQRKDKVEHPEKYYAKETKQNFDLSKIKLTIPNIKFENYKAIVNDLASGHSLTLQGEKLKLAYCNGKVAKLKTNAIFLSDKDTKITANLDINTFLPKFSQSQKEEIDNEAVFSVPFYNPVTTYRDYNLRSNIESKLKIRKESKSGKIKLNGFANIENTTVTLSGLELPESYFRLKSRGTHSKIDTNLFVTSEEFLQIMADVNYGERPKFDLSLKSTQVHFDNLLKITKAYLDTIHINNDIKNMSASGYLYANANIKTDYKTLNSDGKVLVRNGSISNEGKGILFGDINANFIFDDNELAIKDTQISINGRPLNVSGEISTSSIANLNIKGDKIPLTGLYSAFAPREFKNSYRLKSAFLTLDARVAGQISDLAAVVRANLEDLNFADNSGEFVITNKNSKFGLGRYAQDLKGQLLNRGLVINFPKRHSIIKNDEFKIDINNDKITIKPSEFHFNKQSVIKISGGVTDYLSNLNALITASGNLSANDLADVLLHTAIPYFDVKGSLPLRAKCEVKGLDLKSTIQVAADPKNYITPVNMDDFYGKQTIIQMFAEKNKNNIKISKTGFFVKTAGSVLSDNLAKNIQGAKEIIKVRGIISNISTQPFISLVKIILPENLNGSIYILPKSKFTLGGHLHIYGKPEKPVITGKIDIKKFNLPELLTRMNRIVIELGSNKISAHASKINANGNDLNILAVSDWNKIADLTFTDVRIFSRYINVSKILKVPEAGEKAFPGSAQDVKDDSGKRPENPVKILNGSLKLNKIVMDNLVINNTSSDLKMHKSTVFLNNLKTSPFGGSVFGNVTYNILGSKITAKVSGQNFDVEKVLLETMNMKDMVSGVANFIADISFEGTSINDQLKSLKGYIDFNIKNGQLGPFGKIENFLMAENIRENAFFSSTIGSVITNLVTFDTSRFNSLYGHLTFEGGTVNISPIKSQGNVMSMFILGKAGLLDNTADIKVRAKLASAFSDKLGPLANINPINLVKHTPGLNIVAVKMFALFCEEVSEEEMNAIPELGEGKSDENATKLQIKLRGDTRKPLKMLKSFKWLALDSDIQNAKDFVDTLPTPEAGEEDLSVEELIELRKQQAMEQAAIEAAAQAEAKKPINKLKNIFKNETSK